jgi:hypothetical protein
MERVCPSLTAEKETPDGFATSVNVPLRRPRSSLSVWKLMLKTFGGDFTTPAVVTEIISPAHVVPFKGVGPAAKAMPAAEKNRTKSPTTNMFLVFVISKCIPLLLLRLL